MEIITFLHNLYRHSVWALSTFVLLTIGMELLMPGSVAPYLDPVPYAILAIVFLSIDAMQESDSGGGIVSILKFVFVGIFAILVLSMTFSFDGKSALIGFGVMVAMVLLMVGFLGTAPASK